MIGWGRRREPRGLKGFGDAEGEHHRRQAEQHRPHGLTDEHALRSEARAEGDEGNGAQRRSAPVQQGREARPVEVVEGGVGDEEPTGEDHGAGDPAAEQVQQRRCHAVGGEGERQQVLRQSQDNPGRADRHHHEDEAGAQRLADPIGAPRAEILRHDRPDGAAQREDHPEGDRRDAVDRRLTGNSGDAETRHGVGDEGAAHGGREVGQNRRQRDMADAAEIGRSPAGAPAAQAGPAARHSAARAPPARRGTAPC